MRTQATTGLPLFDMTEAEQSRDIGIARADAGAEDAWRHEAIEAVRRVCLGHQQFIVDDVWRELGELERPTEARAMGSIILKAVKAGWCERTSIYRKSAQPQCHANPRRVWRSNLHVERT